MIRLTECPYADQIQQAMQAYLPMWDWKYGVAQLYQESKWDPRALSQAEAAGIAQFEPPTWQDMIDQMGFPDIASPYDPVYAIPAYAKYMSQMRLTWTHVQRTEDERRKLAMASYNAGTGNILKAQAAAGGAIDYDSIIAALPQVTGKQNAAQTYDYVLQIGKWYAQLSTQQETS